HNPRSASPRVPVSTPRIVSAQWVVSPAGPPALYVVFSSPMDASSLAPQRFVVALSDGTRQIPEVASFAPASESDELRTVALRLYAGEKDVPAHNPEATEPQASGAAPPKTSVPVSVTLIGILHTASGEVVEGLSAAVEATSEVAKPVHAEWMMPGPGRCEGYPQAIRLVWSKPLPAGARPWWSGEDPGASVAAMAGKFVATLQTGQQQQPVAFDDIYNEIGGGSHGARVDNVLDLCFDKPARVGVIEVRSDGVHPLEPPVSVAVEGISLR
ncbi:MAG: hypothetical protein ACPG4T_17850, partial [Nannocystaceae bacterium]